MRSLLSVVNADGFDPVSQAPVPEVTPSPELRDEWAEGVPAEVFARYLGFPSSCTLPIPPTEQEKLHCILALQAINHRIDESDQGAIYSAFCAVYLPLTVDRFLHPPPSPHAPLEVQVELTLNNAYFAMLRVWVDFAYFEKFLRSRQPVAQNNKILFKVIAGRFLRVAPIWDIYIRQPPRDRSPQQIKVTIASTLKMFRTLYRVFVADMKYEEIFPEALRTPVIAWCRRWFRLYPEEDLGHQAFDVLAGFEIRPQLTITSQTSKDLKKMELCSLQTCGNRGLKKCARCQTVKYCCVEHQREHWKRSAFGHRSYCYETEY